MSDGSGSSDTAEGSNGGGSGCRAAPLGTEAALGSAVSIKRLGERGYRIR
jgi:hypothetical protein